MNPRAMSLQTNQNPYLQQQQQQQGQNSIYNGGINNGSLSNVRANTMTSGQPPRFIQMQGQPGGPGGNQQPQMNRGPDGQMQQMGGPGPMHQMNSQGPPQHTMSLTNNSRPNMGNMGFNGGMQNNGGQGGMQQRDPNMMMQMGQQNRQSPQQNFNPNQLGDQNRTMSLQNNPISRAQFQRDTNDSGHPSSTSSVPTTASSDLNYHIAGTSTTSSSSDHIRSPLSKKMDWPEQVNATRSPEETAEPKAKLNVLQLSKPQQDELQERESRLSEREKELLARE